MLIHFINLKLGLINTDKNKQIIIYWELHYIKQHEWSQKYVEWQKLNAKDCILYKSICFEF